MSHNALTKLELAPIVKKARMITTMIISMFILMLFLPWQQTAKGEGALIAYHPNERNYNILAPISGLVDKYYIEEDQYVNKGTLLFEMVDMDAEYLPKLKAIIGDIDARTNNAQSSLSIMHERKKNLQQNLKTGLEIHDNKILQIEDKLKILHLQERSKKNNYAVSASNYERVKLLFSEGIESKRTYELAENEYIRLGIALDSTRIDIEAENKNLEIRKKEKETFLKERQNNINELNSAILGSENSIKSLEQENKKTSIDLSRNSTAKVYAKKDGYTLRVLKNDLDHYIKQGEPIIHFSPKVTKKALLLKVRSLDMPLMKVGLPVRVQFYGWPSIQVSGWPKITFGTFGGLIDKIDPIAHEKGVFYAYVIEDPSEPWPSNDTLKIGTEASAWVRLSTVPIAYEIWRLHNALPPSMVTTPEYR